MKHRPDINSLLDYLEKDGYLGSNTVQGIRDRAMIRGSSDDGIEKCVEGATYVGLEDSMHMQHEIGEDNCIKVTLDMDEGGCSNVISTKCNWITSIIHCQKVDKGGYGAWFPAIPSYQCNDRDSRVVWILSGMIVCVKELWFLTNQVDIHVSKWHGWLLAYLTKVCFPEVIFRNDQSNPIKKKHVSTIPKLLEKWLLKKEQVCLIISN